MTDTRTGEEVVVISPDGWSADLDLVQGTGHFREIVGPTLGARERSLHHIDLGPDSTTAYLSHPDDAVYYVVSGIAQIQAAGTDENLVAGSMVHILASTAYRLASIAGAVVLGGPSPVDPGLYDRRSVVPPPVADVAHEGAVTIHHQDRPGLMMPMISADARLVVWLGSGALTANMNYVVLEAGERNREHVHLYSADTIHILEGHGTAEDLTHGLRLPIGPGDTVHIKPGIWHAVSADRNERVVSVGGPCPADLDMLHAAGVDVDALTKVRAHST